MISASHNPHHDNGIKLFGPDGYKLDDSIEAEISALAAGSIALAEPTELAERGVCDSRLAVMLNLPNQHCRAGCVWTG